MAKEFLCPEPDCGKVFPTEGRLAAHRRMAPDHARPTSATSKEPAKKTLDPGQVLDLFVENVRTVGALIAPVAPHLGVTLHGVESEKKGEWIIPSRALLIGKLLRERVHRDQRLVALLVAINRLFETPDVIQLGGGVMAAVAVDTGRVAPDLTIPLFGGRLPLQPVKLLIGDVVDFVAAETGASPPGQNGAEPKAPATEVAGGVTAT